MSSFLKITSDHKAGSCHEPFTGTHISPPSETAKGGIVLYWGGVWVPKHAIEKNFSPLLRTPATWSYHNEREAHNNTE